MKLFRKKNKELTPEQQEVIATKDFFDCVAPGTIKFLADSYIVGDSYRCAWAIKEYPPSTEEQAILSQLADRNGVTLRIYHRLVEPMEQRQIVNNANRKNRLMSGDNDLNQAIEAEGNLQDVVTLIANLRKNREPLLHCAVFLELKAKDPEALKELQSDIAMELTRSKITVDRLTLRQQEGYLSVVPFGSNRFGAQYERVLPASSVANLYPFNFSGRTDPKGFYIGRDKYGTNILVDLDRRSDGHVLTRSYYEAKLEQYPEGVGNYADFIQANWLGKRTADCVGLIKGYCWFDPEAQSIGYAVNGMPDVGADSVIGLCSESGSLDTMPEIPGLVLWKQGHVGIYIGSGYAIEAMGTRYGVVKTQVAGRGWAKWGKLSCLEFVAVGEEAITETDP